jgi:RecB family endonuclease NucS
MRILRARCEIAYHGRATTRLTLGDRVMLFKTASRGRFEIGRT